MEMEHSPGRYGRDRRLATQWEFQSRCTWSHSVNDGSVGGGEATGPENVSCLHCDKGPSIFDVRHNVTVNAVVPYSASYNALLRRYSSTASWEICSRVAIFELVLECRRQTLGKLLGLKFKDFYASADNFLVTKEHFITRDVAAGKNAPPPQSRLWVQPTNAEVLIAQGQHPVPTVNQLASGVSAICWDLQVNQCCVSPAFGRTSSFVHWFGAWGT